MAAYEASAPPPVPSQPITQIGIGACLPTPRVRAQGGACKHARRRAPDAVLNRSKPQSSAAWQPHVPHLACPMTAQVCGPSHKGCAGLGWQELHGLLGGPGEAAEAWAPSGAAYSFFARWPVAPAPGWPKPTHVAAPPGLPPGPARSPPNGCAQTLQHRCRYQVVGCALSMHTAYPSAGWCWIGPEKGCLLASSPHRRMWRSGVMQLPWGMGGTIVSLVKRTAMRRVIGRSGGVVCAGRQAMPSNHTWRPYHRAHGQSAAHGIL